MTIQSPQSAVNCKFRRLLVTGATGFMGRSLVERLAGMAYDITALGMRQKDSVFAPTVEYITGDLTDREWAFALLQPWRWDGVINLAGPILKDQPQWEDEYLILSNHINITLNVCLAIPKGWSGRFIHASSSKGVIISSMHESYWSKRYVTARRIIVKAK